MDIPPLVIMGIGIASVLVLILVARLNAFLALIISALIVSLLAPGMPEDKITRVALAFGSTCGSLGIVISLAAIIGSAMMESGASDRIVRFFVKLLGEKRAPVALLGSGFVLSVPVFFDTVFYLLVPLARSFYINTGKDYMRCLLAITAGGVLTHALVPPTPGPLLMANALDINMGLMIGIGILCGIPAAIVGHFFAQIVGSKFDVKPDLSDLEDEIADPTQSPVVADEKKLPGLFLSLLPIVLPVALIGIQSFVQTIDKDPASRTQMISYLESAGIGDPDQMVMLEYADQEPVTVSHREATYRHLVSWVSFFGNPNIALLLSTFLAMLVYHRYTNHPRAHAEHLVEHALTSAGMIILITAAGAAFGAMLRTAGVGGAIEEIFKNQQYGPEVLLYAGFALASILKFAQGSSTTAMIIGSSMMAAIIAKIDLPYHPVYLATSIGAGSLFGSWMNDSGFWIFTRMGNLTESQGLKSWTPCLATVGLVAFLMSLLLANVMPMDTATSAERKEATARQVAPVESMSAMIFAVPSQHFIG